MKYLKLFESWNETKKEELKKNYEKYVMDKDYIPNLIKEKIEESFGYNSPIIQQIEVDFKWDPIAFNELSEEGYLHNTDLSDDSKNNVCVAGILRTTFDPFYTKKGDHFSDETAVINERMDSALAKATKELGSKLMLPYKSFLDNSGSHGPNCFIRDKKIGMIIPEDGWYNQIMGIRPPGNRSTWGNDWYRRKIVFTTFLVLDKSYCEDK